MTPRLGLGVVRLLFPLSLLTGPQAWAAPPPRPATAFNVTPSAAPTVSVADVSANEGNSGTTAFNFVVSLSASINQNTVVSYSTADGTATAGSDYAATSGTLSFPAGTTTRTITVVVNGDSVPELDETFFVNLSAAANAGIADSQGVGTIRNASPGISIGNVAVSEGDSGTIGAVFTVSLSFASAQTVTVNYATANGTAVAPGDYTAASVSLTFAPGETSKQSTVHVNGDRAVNGLDLTAFRNGFGTTMSDPGYVDALDFNHDGVINGADLTQFRNRFGMILP